ncbi:MAG: hypothetical protein QF903_10110 [Planctomycetota bacterium]|jgi:hypothetical protein|nr:hypothetical protein [Planctomycetota bacterium]MDP6989820.1 hypothetical protein [Planctomycetota bacterium]
MSTTSYTPRTIAFLCDLLHAQRTPDNQAVQQLHNELFGQGNPPYSSFAVTPMGPLLTNPAGRPGVVSQVVFLPDRIQFREEQGGLTCESFAERVRTIASMATERCGIERILAQQVTVRSLVNPRHYPDSIEFMRSGMLGVAEQLESFGRDPRILGLRLVFPPEEESPTANALRIESFHQDPRSLYVENQGTFRALDPDGDLRAVEENVTETYRFLVDRALRFVGAFDQPAAEDQP